MIIGNQTASIKGSLSDTVLPCCRQGDSILIEYFQSHYEYPESAISDNIEGRILVQFTVNSDSSVSNISILHSLQTDWDNEALQVVGNMPDWNAGTIADIPVSMVVVVPIILQID